MRLRWEIQEIAALPLGALTLKATRRVGIPEAYDHHVELGHRRMVVVDEGGEEVDELEGLADLRRLARREGIDLLRVARPHAHELACLIAEWSDLGSVVRPGVRCSFLRPVYGIRARRARVEDGALVFLAMNGSLDHLLPPVREVRVTVGPRTLRVRSRIVARARRPR